MHNTREERESKGGREATTRAVMTGVIYDASYYLFFSSASII